MNFQDVLRDYNSGQNQGGIYKNTAVNPGQVNTPKSGFSQFMNKVGWSPMTSPGLRGLTQSPTQGTVQHTPAFNAQVAANPMKTATPTPATSAPATPNQSTGVIDDATKTKLVELAKLGVSMQGDPQMQEAIYNEILNQYVNAMFPKDQLTDYETSLNMYEVTGDERFKEQALSQYYASQGKDYTDVKAQDALLSTFSADFPTEGENGATAVRNAKIQQQAKNNPGLVEQYYELVPGAAGKAKREAALRQLGFTF